MEQKKIKLEVGQMVYCNGSPTFIGRITELFGDWVTVKPETGGWSKCIMI